MKEFSSAPKKSSAKPVTSARDFWGGVSPLVAVCLIVQAMGVALLVFTGVGGWFFAALLLSILIVLPLFTWGVSRMTLPSELLPSESNLTIVLNGKVLDLAWTAVRTPPIRYGPFGGLLSADLPQVGPRAPTVRRNLALTRRQYFVLLEWLTAREGKGNSRSIP